MVKNHWEKVSPEKRRYIVLGVIVVLILGLLSIFTPSNDKKRVAQEENVIERVLTDTNTRELGVDALAARLETLAQQNEDLRRDQERLKEELSRNEGTREAERLKEDLRDLKQRLKEEEKERTQALRDLRRSLDNNEPIDNQEARNQQGESGANDTSDPQSSGSPVVKDDLNARDVFEKPSNTQANQRQQSRAGSQNRGKSSGGMEIVTIVDESKEEEAEDGAEHAGQYLATGSILTGVIVAGMDAPTGQAARRDPFPALLRIKHDAILPNRFKQDVRECFLTASGFGDLSSERAYLRAEMISCIREDGGVIEKNLKAFATGEDGKAGVRGRLVSRQGQLIGRSMMAGFMQGVAEMFDVNPVPTINTTSSDTQQYQRVLSSDAMQGAAVKGTGKALDRIAQFYIDMAEDMYPVVEVDAGRRVDFIVQKGVSLDAN